MDWSAFGRQIDQYAYDFLFRLEQPARGSPRPSSSQSTIAP